MASEVARLRREIALSYEAAARVFESPGIIAPHSFITARMERISDIEAQLVDLVGADEATRLTIEAMRGAGDAPASS